jgi:hypothetical protein
MLNMWSGCETEITQHKRNLITKIKINSQAN